MSNSVVWSQVLCHPLPAHSMHKSLGAAKPHPGISYWGKAMAPLSLAWRAVVCHMGSVPRGRCSPCSLWEDVVSRNRHDCLSLSQSGPLREYKGIAPSVVCVPREAPTPPSAHSAGSGWFHKSDNCLVPAVLPPSDLKKPHSCFVPLAHEVVPATCASRRRTLQQKLPVGRPGSPLPNAPLSVSAISAYTTPASTAHPRYVPSTCPAGKVSLCGATVGNASLGKGANSENGTANGESSTSGPEPSYVKIRSGYHLLQCGDGFTTSYGGHLSKLDIAYETWGTLNDNRSNAVLLTCGLSASSHAKSSASNPQKGWWEDFIGSGRALDTDRFFVICVANLGSCYGTTGPSSFYRASSTERPKRYGLKFPMFSVKDMVRVMFRVVDHLGIGTLHAVVGSSLGGMQSLAAAVMFPDRVNRVVSISASAASSPLSIALRFAQRQVLMADPAFKNGEYYDSAYPVSGMKLARVIATITYRSGPEWSQRFGRQRVVRSSSSRNKESNRVKSEKLEEHLSPSLGIDFTVEAYLEHQGRKWCHVYDPNSMLFISKAMDLFSLAEVAPDTGEPSLAYGLRNVQMPALIVGVQSDILFPLWQQEQTARALRDAGNKSVAFYTLDSIYGHDTFLIDVANVGAALKGHLEQSYAWHP